MNDWIAFHARAFGMTRPEEIDMIRDWANAFSSSGHSCSDLMAATKHLLAKAAPKFRTDHLVGIQAYLATQRARSFQGPAEDPRGTCTECSSIGWIIVPHPKFVCGLEWIPPYPTCAVACVCAKGNWLASRVDNHEEFRPPVNREKVYRFSEYRQRFPNWKELVATRDAEKAAMSKVRGRTSSLDKLLGSLAAKFAARA